MFPWKKALLTSSILLLDLVILCELSVLLMDYDDSYDGPPAEYGAWHTMPPFQRGVSASHRLWLGANALALGALVYGLVKKARSVRRAANQPS
jgi:hypothetical protein